MYDVMAFGNMLHDRVRLETYREAMRRVMTPDSVVLDIGAGAGIMSLIACQLGARHVYAIEPLPSIHVAKQIARDNGFEDRITFIQGLSNEITLPEKADVLVADLRGRMPFMPGNVESFADARERLLKPGAHIIPQKDFIWIAGAYDDQWYQRNIQSPWIDNDYGLDMSAALPYVADKPRHNKRSARQDPVTEPRLWFEIDYTTDNQISADHHIEWKIYKETKLTAYDVWFDALVADGLFYSGRPGAIRPDAVYGTQHYPLREEITLVPRDTLKVHFQLFWIQDHYVASWRTDVMGADGKAKYAMRQSTFTNESLQLKSELNKSK